MRMSVDKAAARASVDVSASKEEERRLRREVAEGPPSFILNVWGRANRNLLASVEVLTIKCNPFLRYRV
eukprot:1132684-Rhodomonas_salina.1